MDPNTNAENPDQADVGRPAPVPIADQTPEPVQGKTAAAEPVRSTAGLVANAAGAVDAACKQLRTAIADEAANDGLSEMILRLTDELRNLEARLKSLRAFTPTPTGNTGLPRPVRVAGTRLPGPANVGQIRLPGDPGH